MNAPTIPIAISPISPKPASQPAGNKTDHQYNLDSLGVLRARRGYLVCGVLRAGQASLRSGASADRFSNIRILHGAAPLKGSVWPPLGPRIAAAAIRDSGARWRVGSISYTHQGATFMALEVVFIELCLPDMDPGRLDMARVRHYRDLIRGGGTLAPIHVSSDDVILDGHHRLAALAAEGVSSVAAVRIDRVMRRKPAMITYDDLINSRDQPRADRFRRQR